MYKSIFVLLGWIYSSVYAQPTDSLDIKIGQLLLVGLSGSEVEPLMLENIRKGKVGGVLLFEKNIAPENSYSGLKNMINLYQKNATIPLFVGIDQEGGKVNRLKEKYGFPQFLSHEKMGQIGYADSTRQYGELTALTLANLGINVNFAPVVDVAVNSKNPVISQLGRSFSAHPDTVAERAAIFIQAHRRFGVISVIKHFPGHGSSSQDSHEGMADVTHTWSTSELIPYEKLLNKNLVDGIMTAHIVNEKLDPEEHPATLSKKMIDELLRKKMGYTGVIFSDDLQMKAITTYYGQEETVKYAIQAGVDVLCFSNNLDQKHEQTIDSIHKLIRQGVEDGKISETRINESFRRIMKLKKRLNTSPH